MKQTNLRFAATQTDTFSLQSNNKNPWFLNIDPIIFD